MWDIYSYSSGGFCLTGGSVLARIRAQAAAGIDVSQHAADEMDAEAITLDDVWEVLATVIL